MTGMASLLESSASCCQDLKLQVSMLRALRLTQGGLGVGKGVLLFFFSCRLREGAVSQ